MNGFWQTLRRKRAVLLSLCGVLALCVLAASTARRGGAVPASAEVTNWGLSFQQEGEPPVGNASSEYLAQYNALYRADTQEKILYLTFDAGFENGNTAAILDALKQHNVPATFFLVGNYLETQPELVCRMVEEGHTVGNHTYSHPDMSAIADAESFRQELEKNEALYREVTGQEMPMWTGTRTNSPPQSRPLKSSSPGCTLGRWCCSTARPPPTPPFWMSCSPAGRSWATPLAGWKKSRYNSKIEIKSRPLPVQWGKAPWGAPFLQGGLLWNAGR